MWAAANVDDARRRRNNRNRRRPPAASASATADHNDDKDHGACDYDGDSDSTAVKSPLRDSSSSSSSRRGHSKHGWSGKNDDSTQRGGKRKRVNDENNENEQQGEGGAGSTNGKKRQKKKKQCTVIREETPEATLSRLQSSYATSMTAVGALHRLSHQLCAILGKKNEGGSEVGENTDNVAPSTTIDLRNDQPSSDKAATEGEAATYLTSLKRVAHAARCAFERSLLLDPVILAPILLSTTTAVTINNNKKKIADDHGGSRSRMNVNAMKDVGTAPSSAWLDTWKDHHHSSRGCSDSTTTATTWCSQVIIQSTTKWGKFSAAQRRVIRQVSYLALVNYADLLLCGCMCHRHCAKSTTKLAPSRGDVLDRGAVSNIQALHLLPSSLFATTSVSDQETMMTDENDGGMDSTRRALDKRDCHSNKCLWRDDESAQMTVRLALAAYCDASELDPTDPTLWLKLACAARALGRMVDAPASSSSSSSCEVQATHDVGPPPRSYRSLERLALERGLSSLPRGVPPNRLIARAWREMEDWDRKGHSANYIEDEMDLSTMDNTMISGALDDKSREQAIDQPTELVLHLPKYSWVTLGRILIQASKEGASYGQSSLPCDICTVRHVWSTNCNFSEDYEFGSPLVDVRLSPLLAVPLGVFGIMCGYMEEVDVIKLACTCTAMSSNVTSVTSESSKKDACFKGLTEYAVEEDGAIGLGADRKATEPQQPTYNQELNSLPRRGRVSKRVRSQLITTEKQAERKSKRSSVEYCLLAGVLSCTAQNPYFTKMLKTNQPSVSRTIMKGRGLNSSLDADERPPHLALLNASCSPASLNEFILKWSRRNSGPRNLLEQLLIHISLNIVDVFEGEMSKSLSSCIIDCFETIILSSAEGKATGAQWFGAESFSKAGDLDLARAFYAVNLLNAELRFMRCESCDVGSPEQQDDSDYLSFAVPNLLLFASETSEFDSCRQILELQLRSYWLACSYYLWVARCTDNSIAKAAEGTALDYLSNSIMLFSENSHCHGLRIKTPHLISLDRRGDYWHEISAEILSKYKDHIHSSAIVSRARQYFQDLSEMNDPGSSCDGSGNHTADDAREKLTILGSELLDRFNVSSENSTENLDELMSDFRLIHEEDLFPSDVDILSAQSAKTIWKSEVHWGKIWTDIPSSTALFCVPRKGVRPSIIQVLATSLLTSKEKISSVLMVYLKMALVALCRFKETHDSLQIRSDQQVEITDDNDCTAFDFRSRRDFLPLRIANFFSDKITDIITSITDDTTMNHSFEACIADGDDMSNFLSESFCCSPTHQLDSGEAILYTQHIKSVSRLVNSIRNSQWLSRQNQERIESVFFVALLKAVIRQKIDIVYLKSSTTDKRTKKWLAQVASKADLMFVLASEVAELLSLNPSVVCADGTTRISHLIKALQDIDTAEKSYSVLAQFSEALLWFWEFLHDTSSPANILMVPIAAAIIALCGSYGVTVEGAICKVDDGSDRDTLSFSDYFDSEDSVNGSFLPGDSSEDDGKRTRRLSLRKVCQLVQCVSIVFQSVGHKIIEQSCPSLPSSHHGPFLPLVAARVLSNMSRALFQLFSQDARGDAYPFGARECGATIDSLLGKAYRYLHGFSFSSSDSVSSNTYAPESIEAANSLFHCIKRVYRDSRKVSSPSKAFEVIALSLPAAEESNVSIAIKAFLFDADKGSEVEIQSHTMQPTTLPSGFPEWVFDTGSNIVPADEREDDIELLRRGVAYELAKGSMTNLDSTQRPQSNDEENQSLSAEREMTQNHELCLYQKFLAVLNDLCYDPKNIERWVVLSECLGFKADSICDRLVRVQDPFDSSEFGLCSMSKRGPSATLSLDQLKASQLDNFQGSRSNNWKPYLGNNLHVYMQYPWSNLSSLEACAKEIRSCFSQLDDDASDSDCVCWKEIQSKFDNGDYASWANSWGGLFVKALRKMRLKALLVARHLAMNSQDGMHPSEVCEDLGTALYGDLMASTVYGYPIHHMTLHEKRTIAEHSNMYFQEAIELATCNKYSQKCHIKPFESFFMVGKGYEKIGSTLRDEQFVVNSEGAHTSRSYETVMKNAIQNYAMAVSDAQKAELSCGRPDKVGGSSHGALECLYRLHACRFKVILSAVKCAPSECELAELEAFRIASSNWFSETHIASTDAGVREKTWCIFADCVDAFVHCRAEVPTFHRAAYRLAQAYNYAPLYHNTNCDLIAGSRQTVPPAKSLKVRGLHTTSCAESANVAISKLFDKRRSQLCSVWVTTSTAPSPFEVINDSIRKYDALRMKYILAFVDCMRVCKRIDSIETFLTWTSWSDQDLPGFYEVSASLRGSDPGKHIKQSYLSTRGIMAQVKRIASNALAEIILCDLADMKRIGIDNDARLKLNSHFQLSYRLFQLMNSSCRDVAEFIRSNNRLPVVDAFGKCYLAIQAGYRMSSIDFEEMDSETMCSILEGASAKAKTMMHDAKTSTSKKDKE